MRWCSHNHDQTSGRAFRTRMCRKWRVIFRLSDCTLLSPASLSLLIQSHFTSKRIFLMLMPSPFSVSVKERRERKATLCHVVTSSHFFSLSFSPLFPALFSIGLSVSILLPVFMIREPDYTLSHSLLSGQIIKNEIFTGEATKSHSLLPSPCHRVTLFPWLCSKADQRTARS